MTWADSQLQSALSSLANAIDWPVGPDLAPTVLDGLGRPTRPNRRWLAVAVAALAVVLVLLTPPGQEAVAWLLRVAGIRVELTETVPLSPPTKLIDEVEVSIAEAEAAVGFDLLLPDELSVPDSVQLMDWGGGQQVAMLWNESSQLPEVMETGVGLLLIQFEARVDEQLLLKEASPSTEITPVRVDGNPGFFLSGAPHTVYFEGSDGVIADDQIRLAGNVLIWMGDGVTFRIESGLDLEKTLRIAESLG